MKKTTKCVAVVLIFTVILCCLTGCGNKAGKYTLKMEFNKENVTQFIEGIAKSEDIKSVYIEDMDFDGWSGADAVAEIWVETSNGREFEADLSFGISQGKRYLYMYAEGMYGYDQYLHTVISRVEEMLGGESKIATSSTAEYSVRYNYSVGDYSCVMCGDSMYDISWYEISIHV